VLGGFVQRADDVDGSGAGHGVGGDAEPGVVVDDVEHLEFGAVRDPDVGDVCLPALVGEVGGEADPAAVGPLVGLGGDEAPGLEDPPDRRDRRRGAEPLVQVVAGGLGAGVETGVDQLFADGDDRLVVAIGDPRR
jgi:hypothetical protein